MHHPPIARESMLHRAGKRRKGRCASLVVGSSCLTPILWLTRTRQVHVVGQTPCPCDQSAETRRKRCLAIRTGSNRIARTPFGSRSSWSRFSRYCGVPIAQVSAVRYSRCRSRHQSITALTLLSRIVRRECSKCDFASRLGRHSQAQQEELTAYLGIRHQGNGQWEAEGVFRSVLRVIESEWPPDGNHPRSQRQDTQREEAERTARAAVSSPRCQFPLQI